FEGGLAVLFPFEAAVFDECAPRHIERALLPEALVFVPCQFLCMFHSGNYITILTRCQSKSAVFFLLSFPLKQCSKPEIFFKGRKFGCFAGKIGGKKAQGTLDAVRRRFPALPERRTDRKVGALARGHAPAARRAAEGAALHIEAH